MPWLSEHVAFSNMAHRRVILKDLLTRSLYLSGGPDWPSTVTLKVPGYPGWPLTVRVHRGFHHDSAYWRVLHGNDRAILRHTWEPSLDPAAPKKMILAAVLDGIELIHIWKSPHGDDWWGMAHDPIEAAVEVDLTDRDNWPPEPGLMR